MNRRPSAPPPVAAPGAPAAQEGAAPAAGQEWQNTKYTQAVLKYADVRMQFDAGCQATPNAATYKNGTTVMLDNRSEETRSIVIGGRTYTVPGLSYAIVKLTSAKLPATYMVDCDFQQNIATILLQR